MNDLVSREWLAGMSRRANGDRQTRILHRAALAERRGKPRAADKLERLAREEGTIR